jgi:threonyl-tRNA synthetase
VIDALALPHEVAPGGGAFYGPKLEFVLRDRRGRPWQCGTIQLDLVMPHQFDVRYVTPSGAREHVVMLHRALYGSIERFLGILLEHHRGALPAWLAPEQVAVVPIADAQHACARELADRLAQAGLRIRIDGAGETLSRRIAIAHHDGVPFVAVIGAREVETNSVALRAGGERLALPREAAISELVRRCGVIA